MPARIVLLNGVGSAGKSSIARALQEITATPFLHVAMDAFLDMLPAAVQDHPGTFRYEALPGDGPPEIAIRTGPLGERLMRGMRRAVAALAAEGNDLIVDEVMVADDWVDYARLLAPFTVHLVGVHAPIEVLEERERARGVRLIGLARWQIEHVHRGLRYDLEVDTSKATPLACASIIKETFGL